MRKKITIFLMAVMLSLSVSSGNMKKVLAHGSVEELGGEVVVDAGAADSGDTGSGSSSGGSSTSGYSAEQIAAAKAWLSSHGYSPTRAGANQAYQDYLAGKFDNDPQVRKYKGLDSNTDSSNISKDDSDKSDKDTKDTKDDETSDDKETADSDDNSTDATKESGNSDKSNDSIESDDKNDSDRVDVAVNDIAQKTSDDVNSIKLENTDKVAEIVEEFSINDALVLPERRDDEVYLKNVEPTEETPKTNYALYLLIPAVILVVGAAAYFSNQRKPYDKELK